MALPIYRKIGRASRRATRAASISSMVGVGRRRHQLPLPHPVPGFILSQMIAERHTGQQRNTVGWDGASRGVLFFRQTDEQEEELADPWREAEQAHEAGSEAERILPRGRVFGPVRGYVVDKSIACQEIENDILENIKIMSGKIKRLFALDL